jgi:cytochrome P450
MRMTDVSLGALQHDPDPYPHLERLREAAPVTRITRREGLDDGWLLTRYDDVLAALSDPRLSSDPAYAAQPLGPRTGPQHRDLVASDPPDHTRLRKVVARAFTPRRVEAMRPRVQGLVEELLDGAAPSGELDVRGDFAYPLTVGVISEMLGLPRKDLIELRGWADVLTTPAVDDASAAERERAWSGLCTYIEEETTGRPRGDDMLTVLCDAHAGGELSDAELVSTVVLLFISGFQSPVSLIVNGMRVLLEHPDQLAALRADPALLEPAVEELIRFDGPVAFGPYRYAMEDIEIGGVTIPKGQAVYLGYGPANRDPRRFAHAGSFDLARADGPHLGFGRGIHRCVGPQLARIEATAAIGRLIERFPDLALAVPRERLTWRGSANRAVPERLPVTLTAPRR